MSYRVKPGKQLADVISAMPGGMAEKFLKAMPVQSPRQVEQRYRRRDQKVRRPLRVATPWSTDGECESSFLKVVFPTGEQKVTLKLGVREGVFLLEDPRAKKFSLKLEPGEKGELVIRIPSKIQAKRILELSCHILMMVLRGMEWKDRNGELHKSPCA